jgi:hypothetical protein
VAFLPTDRTVFVSRRPDGSIYGVWTVRQFAAQEELLETDPQVIAVRNSAPAANTDPSMRQLLTLPQTYYVDRVNGKDTNTGSQAAPWQTIQHACDFIVGSVDCNRQDVTVQLVGSGYTEQVLVATQPLGIHVFTIRGNPANPGACLWAPVTGQTLRATDYAAVVVDGIEFGFTGSGGTCLAAFQFGIIDVQNCLFASCQGGVHMRVVNQGSINITGPYAIDGNADFHIQCDHASVNLGANVVAMNNRQTIGTFISVANGGYVAVAGLPYSGVGAGSGTTGKQYDVSSNGMLRLNGVTLPGNAAGTVSSGGQVL